MASRLLLRSTTTAIPSSHLLASVLLRPASAITTAHHHRGLATATLPPPPKSEATLETIARSPQTTDSEKHIGGVVGGEGRHFQDSASPKDVKPFDLSDPHHGDWVQFHPVYSREQLDSVKVVRRAHESLSDKIASGLVAGLRKGFDIVSLYKHTPLPKDHEKMSLAELRKMGCYMDDKAWLTRILFLETTAAIPGMVAGAVRHLHSLRLMRRDGGWIHTLLEEAENERMHLLTFMTLRNPGWIFRTIVLGAQGVFYNLFFLTYILSPKIAHRFVGFLEEEAVVTYTRVIEEIESGRLPEWENKPAPEIAISYWRLAPDATLLDTIRAVRADEATHRFVNHSLASLEPKTDFNPFSLAEPPAEVRGAKAGFSREESAAFAKEARRQASEGIAAARAEATEGGEGIKLLGDGSK